MKNIISVLLVCLSATAAFAQALKKPYFQQDVAYKINVRLDDEAHELHADYRLTYKNNSGNSLTELKMHLWPNAYKDVTTAFAEQKDRTGDLSFRFSKEKDKGSIDSLNFQVDGVAATLTYDPKTPDMATLSLPKPLATGASCVVTTPFRVHLPYTFSRGGHIDQAYQITQWYPKPAVLDASGWHQMPYLDQGEFYSEYGTFDVSISIPKNYVVAATGTLQTETEQRFLDDLAEKRNPAQDSFPESDKQLKTIRFTAEKVHDFGWFADKRFAVRKGKTLLNNGKTVETWAFFPKGEDKIWEKATEFIGRAVAFYSEKVGEYPYPKACAVRGALKAGGGMEYPMVTVIAETGNEKALDNVVMHEVGHNWFYGVLGSNEREHPWMDEGMNSYIESRYMDTYYKTHRSIGLGPLSPKPIAQEDLVYLFQGRQHVDQASDTHSNEFSSPINYYLGAYGKPTMTFRHLEQYLGTTVMDKAMHDYFDEWQFKHPQPADLKATFERSTGKDLTWFFKDMIATNKKIDYALTGMTSDGKLIVRNTTGVAAPFCISAIKGGKVIGTEWYEGITGTQSLAKKGTIDVAASRFMINEDEQFPEINRQNNTLRTSGFLPTIEPLKLRLGAAWDDPTHTNIFVAPALAWNNYDKTMLGVALYSNVLPSNFDFSVAPMYSFGSKQLSGVADLNYHIYSDDFTSFLHGVTIGASAKQFSQDFRPASTAHLRYTRLSPQVEFEFNTPATSNATATLSLRNHFIWSQDGDYVYDAVAQKVDYYITSKRSIQDATYKYEKAGKYNPMSVTIQAQSSLDAKDAFGESNAFARASAEFKYRVTYKKNGDGLDIRLFAGSMLFDANAQRLKNKGLYGSFSPFGYSVSSNGYNDIAFDQYFFGRNDAEGIWSQQTGVGMGGFKLPTANTQSFGGNTTGVVAALNLRAALPFKLPIKPYLDVAYAQASLPILLDQNPNSPRKGLPIIDKDAKIDNDADQLFYQGGVQLSIFDIFSVNFPLLNSTQLEQFYNSRTTGYFQRVTFTVDLLKLNPRTVLKGVLKSF